MARTSGKAASGGGRRSRKRRFGWKSRVLAVLLLAGLVAAGWTWWTVRHWRPALAEYPHQGVEVGAEDGTVNWKALKAIGADFAYLDASSGADERDAAFVANYDAARAAGLGVGAVHRYDPCLPADGQSANFVTIVPREGDLLPPAVELDKLADDCEAKVSDARVESELMTFLNQMETHTGKPAILKVSRRFENRFGIARRLDRNLWLERDGLLPDYGGKPWMLWTANSDFGSDVSENGLRWVVVQP